MLDVSQIVNDFRIFSGYVQNYKKALENSSLFTFVETNLEGCPRARILCDGVMAQDYTHVSLGQSAALEQTKDYLITQRSNYLYDIEEETVIVDKQQVEINQQAKRALVLYMRTKANKEVATSQN